MTEEIIVSVVMPVYNEERYIENCIDSLLLQDYPQEKMEWIFVDGCSSDKTVELLKTYQSEYPEPFGADRCICCRLPYHFGYGRCG